MLVSQGAKRGDSRAVEELAARRQTPLFLLCSSRALEGETVAARLATEHGPGRVFTTSTLSDRSFLSITGTAAAFAGAYQIARGLIDDLPGSFAELNWDRLLADSDCLSLPTSPPLVLFGPAGKAAAEAFAGYHCESLGPVVACDMKNFTHGVWRGLREGGRHCVFLVADRQVETLCEFLVSRISGDHDLCIVKASGANRTVEPFELFVKMVCRWADLCRIAAATKPNWSPLSIDMTEWYQYEGINSAFDLIEMREMHRSEKAEL